MIVTQEVQKAMKGQNPKLNSKRMPMLPCLARGDTGGDDDVTQLPSAGPPNASVRAWGPTRTNK